jgi:hypothetical protein
MLAAVGWLWAWRTLRRLPTTPGEPGAEPPPYPPPGDPGVGGTATVDRFRRRDDRGQDGQQGKRPGRSTPAMFPRTRRPTAALGRLLRLAVDAGGGSHHCSGCAHRHRSATALPDSIWGVGQAACSPTSATTGPSRAPRCSRRPAGRYPAVPGPASAAGYGQTVALPGGDHLLGGRPSSSARLLGQASASEGNAWESGIPIRSSTDNTWRSSPSGLTCSSDWANLTQKSVEIIPSGKDSPNARPGSWLQAGRSADACGALGGNAPLGVGVRSPLGVGVRSPLVTHAAPR